MLNRERIADLATLVLGFAIARWWGLLFALVCCVLAQRGQGALVIACVTMLAAMVIAMLMQGPMQQGFVFVESRPIANEFGLLLVVAVVAIVVPRYSNDG